MKYARILFFMALVQGMFSGTTAMSDSKFKTFRQLQLLNAIYKHGDQTLKERKRFLALLKKGGRPNKKNIWGISPFILAFISIANRSAMLDIMMHYGGDLFDTVSTAALKFIKRYGKVRSLDAYHERSLPLLGLAPSCWADHVLITHPLCVDNHRIRITKKKDTLYFQPSLTISQLIRAKFPHDIFKSIMLYAHADSYGADTLAYLFLITTESERRTLINKNHLKKIRWALRKIDENHALCLSFEHTFSSTLTSLAHATSKNKEMYGACLVEKRERLRSQIIALKSHSQYCFLENVIKSIGLWKGYRDLEGWRSPQGEGIGLLITNRMRDYLSSQSIKVEEYDQYA